MKIAIRERFSPFSHTPGMACIIPRSCSILEAFPTLIRIDGKEFFLPISGPVRGFTMQLDLEKEAVFVFGRSTKGYFRFRIFALNQEIFIKCEKGEMQGSSFATNLPYQLHPSYERLSLGNHKEQDWDKMRLRFDLKEMVPLLFYLGQKTPWIAPQPKTGTAVLLDWPVGKKGLLDSIEAFCRASFYHMFVPRWVDDQYQGFSREGEGNPFFLLQEGAKKIRSLFFVQTERRLSFLPNLPQEFDAGRLISLEAPGIGIIDLEWSKKTLKKVLLKASASGEILLDLPKPLAGFRINKREKKEGKEPLYIEEGKTYFFDRFEK